MQEVVLFAEAFVVALVVWGFIASSKKAIKGGFENHKMVYFILSITLSPAVAALYLAKISEMNLIDWGWLSILAFIIANLGQQQLKRVWDNRLNKKVVT